MQKILAFLVLWVVAAGSGIAAADEAPAPPAAQPPQEETKPVKPETIPHLGLLLPLKSATLENAAEIIRRGFMAAANVQSNSSTPLPVIVYPTGEDEADIVTVYKKALQAGCQVAVGPLTRQGVYTLAESNEIAVPTLALNVPGRPLSHVPPGLFLVALSIEAEARQAARTAFSEGLKAVITVTDSTDALAKRAEQAFSDEWRGLGGAVLRRFEFTTGQSSYGALRESILQHNADLIFLAANAQKALLVRPFLNLQIPTFATSQIFDGHSVPEGSLDFNNILFLDMPWMVEPDHPAVMVYPRPDPAVASDMQRLYALGIDAYRIAQALSGPEPPAAGFALDGVTGKISLRDNFIFERELSLAQFRQGEVMLIKQQARY